MIDVVGHFGSRLSYATIADQIVHELISRDALGTITNLDDKFVCAELGRLPLRPKGDKVVLLADPQDHLVSALVSAYGKSGVAIFLSPNTGELSPERQAACREVGRIYTPSRWCATTVHNHNRLSHNRFDFGLVEIMPLGVDARFAARRLNRDYWDRDTVSMLHLTTDTFWPGRKGTEELLAAWKIAFPSRRVAPARLTIHCLPQLLPAIHQELGDLELTDEVQLISSPPRGSADEELLTLFSKFDMLVAPSRSEGFGVMPLAALLNGMPVLTTADTGQAEYLCAKKYKDGKDVGSPALGGWLQIPTLGQDDLFGEDGQAPTLRSDQLAMSLMAGAELSSRLASDTLRNIDAQDDWSWETRRAAWVDSLIEWRTT